MLCIVTQIFLFRQQIWAYRSPQNRLSNLSKLSEFHKNPTAVAYYKQFLFLRGI